MWLRLFSIGLWIGSCGGRIVDELDELDLLDLLDGLDGSDAADRRGSERA